MDAVVEDPPRYSRKWFGEIFFACWGLGIILRLAIDILDWDRGGVLYWFVFGPLTAGFFGAGVPWLFLGARDLYRQRRFIWREARSWLLVLVAALATASALVGIAWLVG